MKMDKYDLVLDIIAHPEKYTSEELNEIMADGETREIYNLLCKTDSAIEAHNVVDVDAEDFVAYLFEYGVVEIEE